MSRAVCARFPERVRVASAWDALRRAGVLLLVSWPVLACTSQPGSALGMDAGTGQTASGRVPDPAGEGVQRPGFCTRAGGDAVRDLFCGDELPEIRGLAELEARLALDPFRMSSSYYGGASDAGAPRAASLASDASTILNLNVALLAHSTALSGSLVSPLNPRAIVIGKDTMLAFHRGVQRVELATLEYGETTLFHFYLLSFTQACNRQTRGCSAGDLYTPRIEADWDGVQIQDDEELKNTPSDCRQCHQRGSDRPILLMREFDGPWTHFFSHDKDGDPEVDYPEPLGRDLVRDYRQAKGNEPYAGIPIAILRGSIGLALQTRMNARQPLVFNGSTIQNERWPRGPDGWAAAPARSATWDRAYDAFKRGEQLALPHYQSRPTDPDKQAMLSDAYRRYRSGQLSVDALPDLSDIFPDDLKMRAELGLSTEPDATPAQALIQACGACHNDVLDQTISRARFSIDLSKMDRAERALAIERLQLPTQAAGAMPPPETRALTVDARAQLIQYLRSGTPSAEDAALLARAAALGMASEQKTELSSF